MNPKRHILIVDDDPDCLFQLSFLMKAKGYEVTGLESAAEAEKWLETGCPDLAVLDLMMEREDSGFILCRKIKSRYPEVPVVILTAVTPETGISFDINSSENRRWIQADLYLEKGVNRELISSQIEQMVSK